MLYKTSSLNIVGKLMKQVLLLTHNIHRRRTIERKRKIFALLTLSFISDLDWDFNGYDLLIKKDRHLGSHQAHWSPLSKLSPVQRQEQRIKGGPYMGWVGTWDSNKLWPMLMPTCHIFSNVSCVMRIR